MSRARGKIQRWRAIERILADHSAGLTEAELARRLDVNRSTILRDMRELTEDLPIYQEDDGRWRLNRERYRLRIPLTVHQGMALHLATRLMTTQSDRHNPHAAAAVRAMAEVFKDFAPLISRHLKRSAQLMDARRSKADKPWLASLECLTKAWSSGTAVRLRGGAGAGRAVRAGVRRELECSDEEGAGLRASQAIRGSNRGRRRAVPVVR